MTNTMGAVNYLHSTPALATALRQMNGLGSMFLPVPLPTLRNLSPMYRIPTGRVEVEAQAAVRVVGEIAERMRRVTTAYGEWQEFDIPAYFDLPVAFSNKIVRIVERVSTVHIRFFVDPLLPAFQKAVHFWATDFLSAYQSVQESPVHFRHFIEEAQPAMVARWARLLAVLRTARDQLIEDIGFLATTGAEDERMRWQPLWRATPVVELSPELVPELQQIPTLTLALDFPLPARKQPGRIRRLRRSRERRRKRSRGL